MRAPPLSATLRSLRKTRIRQFSWGFWGGQGRVRGVELANLLDKDHTTRSTSLIINKFQSHSIRGQRTDVPISAQVSRPSVKVPT